MLPGPEGYKSIGDLLRDETVLNGMPFFHVRHQCAINDFDYPFIAVEVDKYPFREELP